MYRIICSEYANGNNYTIINGLTRKNFATTWKSQENATYLLEALVMYDAIIKAGLFDAVNRKLASIREHNERQQHPSP